MAGNNCTTQFARDQPCRCSRFHYPHRRDWQCNAFEGRAKDEPMWRDERLSEMVRNLPPITEETQ